MVKMTVLGDADIMMTVLDDADIMADGVFPSCTI
jgi:hypothetical protein